MILKILMKIWPSLVPIFAYIIWVYIVKGILLRIVINLLTKRPSGKNKNKIIDGEYEVVGGKSTKVQDKSQTNYRPGNFSLDNTGFVIAIYLSLIFLIASFIYGALN